MSQDCICPSLDGYSHIQWIGTYFGDCIRTPIEQLSFGIGMMSVLFYLGAFLPQFIHNFKRKSIQGLSLHMIIVWACGDSANLIGTYLTGQLSSQKLIAQSFIFLDILIILQYFSYYNEDDAVDDEEIDDDSLYSQETLTIDETSPLIGIRSSSINSGIGKNLISSTVIIACVGLACGIQVLDDPKYCDAKPLTSSFAIVLGTFCGWISGLFYFCSRIPQIIENHRLKSVDGLSLGLFIFTIIGNLSYGLSIIIRTPKLDNHFYFQTVPYLIGSLGYIKQELWFERGFVMGGNLLDSVSKDRFDRKKYLLVQEKVLRVLKVDFQDVCSPPALPEKESFGDIDFLIFGQDNLPSASFFTNHPCILSKQVIITNPETSLSFECEGVQVDIKLYHSRTEYDNDYVLMSMGGIGNMLGFALKAIGLKWNLYGLFYIVKINEMNKPFLLLCNSMEIQSFLGLDFSKICTFKTDRQVFQELNSIPFLSYDSVYQRMEHIASKDTQKMRPSVINFLNFYLNSKRSLIHFDSQEFEENRLKPKFQTVITDILKEKSRFNRLNTVKSKFNGAIVSNILADFSSVPLKGPKLGKFTSDFRESFSTLNDFQEFIISHTQDQIKDCIINFYKIKNC